MLSGTGSQSVSGKKKITCEGPNLAQLHCTHVEQSGPIPNILKSLTH